jgi:hypothetical protein
VLDDGSEPPAGKTDGIARDDAHGVEAADADLLSGVGAQLREIPHADLFDDRQSHRKPLRTPRQPRQALAEGGVIGLGDEGDVFREGF